MKNQKGQILTTIIIKRATPQRATAETFGSQKRTIKKYMSFQRRNLVEAKALKIYKQVQNQIIFFATAKVSRTKGTLAISFSPKTLI